MKNLQKICIGIFLSTILFLAMGCNSAKISLLEEKITSLEKELELQETKVQILSMGLTFTARTTNFDSPLDEFFRATEFFERIYEDEGVCRNSCYSGFNNGLAECKRDFPEEGEERSKCESSVAKRHVDCLRTCGGF